MGRTGAFACRVVLAAGALGLLPGTGGAAAQEPGGDADATGRGCTVLSGGVNAGEVFARPFGPGLLFRLRPETHPRNPGGWTIEVRLAADTSDELSWAATPPYRFSNPRYVDTGYGFTAEEAISWRERRFGFPVDRASYDELAGVVRTLLWPGDTLSDRAYDSLHGRWQALLARTGAGVLRIRDADVSPSGPDDPRGRIERLAFDVELCEPGPARLDLEDTHPRFSPRATLPIGAKVPATEQRSPPAESRAAAKCHMRP